MSSESSSSKPIPIALSGRFKVYDAPFAHQVMNNRVSMFCSQCMRIPENGEKLLRCGACELPHYCTKDCQKRGWAQHKNECRRLKAVFPNLPLTEVLFLSKVLDRVLFIAQRGDEHGWEIVRPFSSLVDHKEEIRKDDLKMAHFEKIFIKMNLFRGEAEAVDRELFFDVFCKVGINSHSIHTNAGVEIGMAIDLGVSQYNHSCRPTCAMVFDGMRVFIRPLLPEMDVNDLSKSFISYVDVGRSRYRRRKELKQKWYFECECERCSDPAEDILTALRCPSPGCPGKLLTREDNEPMYIACPTCKNTLDDNAVAAAQELMRNLPASFDPEAPADLVAKYLKEAEAVLHTENVYVTRLRTALLHIKGELDSELPNIHQSIYNNYKLCFPKADRHLGYSLLNVVKSLIEKGERKKAVWYAYEAMSIFEVCLGLEHPFYLQTLALWTFLDTEAPKTDSELLALTKYGDNKPVHLAALLEKANAIVDIHPVQAAS